MSQRLTAATKSSFLHHGANTVPALISIGFGDEVYPFSPMSQHKTGHHIITSKSANEVTTEARIESHWKKSGGCSQETKCD